MECRTLLNFTAVLDGFHPNRDGLSEEVKTAKQNFDRDACIGQEHCRFLTGWKKEIMMNHNNRVETDPSGFVLLAEHVPGIIQEIRYYSTYNFIGDRIDGYEEPCALLTAEAARALKSVSNEMIVQGYRLKVFDAYRPVCAVKHFMLWGLEDQDIRMKPYFYPDLDKQELFEKCYGA